VIILVGSEKGGVGKTAIATALAVLRQRDGRDVVLVDADPQGTSADWAAVREEEHPDQRVQCVQMSGKIRTRLKDLEERYQDIIIDAGGRQSLELRSAMVACDMLISPLRPSSADVWSLEKLLEPIQEAAELNEKLEGNTWAILNLVSPFQLGKEKDEARELISGLEGVRLAQSVLVDRTAHRKSFGGGLCAVEGEKRDAKAAAELELLYQELFSAEAVREAI